MRQMLYFTFLRKLAVPSDNRSSNGSMRATFPTSDGSTSPAISPMPAGRLSGHGARFSARFLEGACLAPAMPIDRWKCGVCIAGATRRPHGRLIDVVAAKPTMPITATSIFMNPRDYR